MNSASAAISEPAPSAVADRATLGVKSLGQIAQIVSSGDWFERR